LGRSCGENLDFCVREALPIMQNRQELGIPEGFRLVLTENIPIRWGDMDAMMHVNNTVYFRYMEQARISWVETMGMNTSKDGDEGPVVASAACKFRKPLTYPGTVEVKVYAGRPGRTSLPTYYEMRRTDDPDTLFATGDALFVWISNATGKPTPFPERLRERLE
jgi:acyl-CoA thioester hydrolase